MIEKFVFWCEIEIHWCRYNYKKNEQFRKHSVTKIHTINLLQSLFTSCTKKVSDYKFWRPTFFAKARATVVLYRDKRNEHLKFKKHQQTKTLLFTVRFSWKSFGWRGLWMIYIPNRSITKGITKKFKTLCIPWHNEDRWWRRWQWNNFWYWVAEPVLHLEGLNYILVGLFALGTVMETSNTEALISKYLITGKPDYVH